DAAHHRVGVDGLHADNAGFGSQLLDIGRYTGNQAAPADWNEHRVDGFGVLTQNLHTHRALTGDHIRVVEGMDEGELFLLFKLHGVLVGVGVAIADEHRFTAQCLYRIDLQAWRGRGHDNHRAAAE